ncbi:putative membrane protein [Herbaspirillum sp. CF444]|uniref:VIT1/CCC1 transporter family protein n=1 Tax=Herbaspirillum sp. CF444 TaxID=1144319 RepID=UPI0002723FE8|nr:VIT family protein [Herbaspirillum sp. CF444]EJL90419.1 putative membrane protein [Herbaspirillum sp. CF444]
MSHVLSKRHSERHRIDAIGWLRAAVLGANDGIVSTASLLLGVTAAQIAHESIVLTGIAGLVAGAMSMATGEYVSVHSQADGEKAALEQERAEIDSDFHGEQRELTAIYMRRGLDHQMASLVAEKLMAHDALGAHARDELGISEMTMANPLQAALVSALSFAVGAALPLGVVLLAPAAMLMPAIVISALCSLAFLGGVAAKTAGAKISDGVIRVTFWSSLAMTATTGIGSLFGAVI